MNNQLPLQLKNVIPTITRYSSILYSYEEGFDISLSSISEVVSLNKVFKSTDLGSSICDVPVI